MVFQCINIRQVPWEVLKTMAFGLGFKHLPRDLRMLMHEKPCLIPVLYAACLHSSDDLLLFIVKKKPNRGYAVTNHMHTNHTKKCKRWTRAKIIALTISSVGITHDQMTKCTEFVTIFSSASGRIF